jgi:hypothetical protein
VTVTTNHAGDLTLVSVPMGTDPNSDAAYAAIPTLRIEGASAATPAPAPAPARGLTTLAAPAD